MVVAISKRIEIEDTYPSEGKRFLEFLDDMDPRVRINLLRALLDYELARVRERIEELNALLPIEDRLQ